MDASAAITIITGGPDGPALAQALEHADSRSMSAGTLVELAIVMDARLGSPGRSIADRFVRDAQIEIVAVDRPAADLAADGWRRYGRGRNPDGLGFGDCFTYALAASIEGASVLCSSEDFDATDLDILHADRARS